MNLQLLLMINAKTEANQQRGQQFSLIEKICQPEQLAAPQPALSQKLIDSNPHSKGSIVYALIIASIGSGALSLPQRVEQMGIFPFIIATCLIAVVSYGGLHLMGLILAEKKLTSYAQMVSQAFGQQSKITIQICLILYTWAQSLLIQILFIKFVIQLLNDNLGLLLYEDRNLEIYSPQGTALCVIIGILMILLNSKFLMMTNLREVLSSVGKLAFFGNVICMLIVLGTAFCGYERPFNEENLRYKSILMNDSESLKFWHSFDSKYLWTIAQVTSVLIFTFQNHYMFFPIVKDLERPTPNRIGYTVRWSTFIQLLIYGLFAILSYLLLAQHSDVFPISSLVISSIPTTPTTIGKLLLTLALFFKLPLQIFSLKEFVYQAFSFQRNDKNLLRLNAVICLSSIVLAITFQKISVYFCLLGGTIGISIVSIFPIICAKKLVPFTLKQHLLSGFMIIASLVGAAGAVTSLIAPV